jgi:hypothetical protein
LTTKPGKLPAKRLRSRVGQRRIKKSLVLSLKRAAAWRPVYELGARLHRWQPGDVGRPPQFPPEAVLLFGIAAQAVGGLTAAEQLFEDPATWTSVRRELAARCEPSRGLQPNEPPMNRTQFARYRDRYGIDERTLETLGNAFRREMSAVATSMGMFAKTRGTTTYPEASNALFGDGTVLRTLTRYTPVDRQVHPQTGEITSRVHDPDAAWFRTGDGTRVYGTKFGFCAGRLPHPNETLILDVFSVSKGHDEAAQAVASIRKLATQLDAQAVVWDGALRGTHLDELYDAGLITVNRVHGSGDGKTKSRNLGAHAFDGAAGTTTHQVWAINGAPHIEVVAAGATHQVTLERTRTRRSQDRGHVSYRWYGDYRVPKTSLVPPELRGAKVSIRLNSTGGDKARHLARADVLRAIAPSDPYWAEIYKLRPVSESINRMVKRRQANGRAPALGVPRQLFHLICAALFHNLEAVLANEQRPTRSTDSKRTKSGVELPDAGVTNAAGPAPPDRQHRALP